MKLHIVLQHRLTLSGVIVFSLIFVGIGVRLLHNSLAANTTSSLGGCQLFPADNIWNYNIASLPVDPNSGAYISHIGSTTTLQNGFGDAPSWGIPYNLVPGSTPFVTIHYTTYASLSVPGPYPVPANALVEQGSDHHVLVLDQGNCKLYELYDASANTDGSWTAEGGTVFDLSSDALVPPSQVSADAGNFAILPGLVKYDEVAAGSITHAISVVVADPRNTYVWPATHTDGVSTSLNAAPYGTRFRLKLSVDISSFSAANQVILAALKNYGMIIADKDLNTPGFSIVGAPDSRWDWRDLALLSNIPASDFEAVDESSLEVSAASGAVEPLPVAGDVNGDSHVNIYDLSILLSHYGQSNATRTMGDLNGDGLVTILDLSILLSNFGV